MKYFIFAIFIFLSQLSHAERAAPAVISPINFGKNIISVKYHSQNDSYSVTILALKASDKSRVWRRVVYTGSYDNSLETDVQNTYLKSLVLSTDKKTFIATDERNQVYRIDAHNGRLLSPKKLIHYIGVQL